MVAVVGVGLLAIDEITGAVVSGATVVVKVRSLEVEVLFEASFETTT